MQLHVRMFDIFD